MIHRKIESMGYIVDVQNHLDAVVRLQRDERMAEPRYTISFINRSEN